MAPPGQCHQNARSTVWERPPSLIQCLGQTSIFAQNSSKICSAVLEEVHTEHTGWCIKTCTISFPCHIHRPTENFYNISSLQYLKHLSKCSICPFFTAITVRSMKSVRRKHVYQLMTSRIMSQRIFNTNNIAKNIDFYHLWNPDPIIGIDVLQE